MNLLTQLADDSIERKPVEVEIVKGQVLRFRPSEEGEVEEARASAEREAEETYYGPKAVVPAAVKKWLPVKKTTFVKADVLSKFVLDCESDLKARKLFCQIAKTKPITFGVIYNQWLQQSVFSELQHFTDQVTEAKKPSGVTESDSSE